MQQDIISNLANPQALEALYRKDKTAFKQAFDTLYPSLENELLADYWQARLHYERSDLSWGSNQEIGAIIVMALSAGMLVKFPDFFPINEDTYYVRNFSFFVLPFLMLFFIWKRKLSPLKTTIALGLATIACIFINLLPDDNSSDTLVLTCIHIPLFLWALLGFTFVGSTKKELEKRLHFLRYNGELAVMSAVILITGFLMTGLSVGLFSLLDIDNLETYIENMVKFGLPATPIVATYVVQRNPQLVNKVSSVIAKIFSPLVLMILVVYLFAVILTGKDPYNDREFLMLFNLMLIGVMALILFSVVESSKGNRQRIGTFLVFALAIVAMLVNAIALSAIIFRISEWGITPNRLTVLGTNLLILSHLCLVTYQLYQGLRTKENTGKVEHTITNYLPVYMVWTAVVCFLFPLIFQFG